MSTSLQDTGFEKPVANQEKVKAILKLITIRTTIIALHNWSDIPKTHPMGFLKHPHRHTFHITVKWEVNDLNRELEFFVMQGHLNQEIRKLAKMQGDAIPSFGSMSCEMIAEQLLRNIGNCCYVSVFEDNENGAELFVEEK